MLGRAGSCLHIDASEAKGGGGTPVAGPAVRRVLSKLFGLTEEGFVSAADTGDR